MLVARLLLGLIVKRATMCAVMRIEAELRRGIQTSLAVRNAVAKKPQNSVTKTGKRY
jgi:hypothetical protein